MILNFRKIFLFCLAGSIVLAYSCSSGYKAYQRGDYYDACMKATEKLRSQPTNQKAQAALLNAYPRMQQNALREIDRQLVSSRPDRYDIIVSLYTQLNRVADAVFYCPKASELIPAPVTYYTEINQTLELAAGMAYNEGIKALQPGTLESARTALQYFIKADKYIPGFRDVRQRIEEARYLATLRVIVTRPLTPPRYQLSAEFFYIRLMSAVTHNTFTHPVRFFTPEEAVAEGMNDPHQLIVLNFEDFTVGNIRESSDTREVKRDSVLVGTTTVQGRKQDVYGTVTAKITVFRRELLSEGVLSLRLINPVNNRIVAQKNFSGKYLWVTEWATYKGDERALAKEQIRMCNSNPQNPPSQQDLFVGFANPLYDQAIRFISSNY